MRKVRRRQRGRVLLDVIEIVRQCLGDSTMRSTCGMTTCTRGAPATVDPRQSFLAAVSLMSGWRLLGSSIDSGAHHGATADSSFALVVRVFVGVLVLIAFRLQGVGQSLSISLFQATRERQVSFFTSTMMLPYLQLRGTLIPQSLRFRSLKAPTSSAGYIARSMLQMQGKTEL
jgi:hypothetical protein